MSERQWLRYPATGGYFHCPVEAVDGWKDMGWQESDPPPEEPNPAVAEILAARAAQAKQATKPAKSGAAGSDKKE